MIKTIAYTLSLLTISSCISNEPKNTTLSKPKIEEQEFVVKKSNNTLKIIDTSTIKNNIKNIVTNDISLPKKTPPKIKLVKKEKTKKTLLLPKKDTLLTQTKAIISNENFHENLPKTSTTHNHAIWNKLLKKYVSSSGQVNYKGLKSNQTELQKYLTLLASKPPLENWSKDEKLAYWINVYNAFTVKLIVDNYPLKSITNLNKPWDKKIINIANVKYSLGDVENNILRKMNEPRIHFAINCASYSCPKLLNEAFTAKQLNTQLNNVTHSFFNDKTKNNLTSNPIQISKIFEWYKDDFYNGNILKYISQYSDKSFPMDTKIEYLEYNWNLNE